MPPTSNGHSEGKKAHERVHEMAGGNAAGFSKADAKAAALIAQAPKTAAKVESGEIRNTSKALREAKAEIAGTVPAPPTTGENVTREKSANEYVSHALHDLKRAAQVYDAHFGQATPREIDDKLGEIIELAKRLRRLIIVEVRGT